MGRIWHGENGSNARRSSAHHRLHQSGGGGLVRLRSRTRLSATASQSADARHSAILGPVHLWQSGSTQSAVAAGEACVSLRANSIGEPEAANLHVRFNERGAETEQWYGPRHRLRAKAAGHTQAADLPPPRRPSTLPRQPPARMTE
jgi:hypothetical protein